MRFSSKVHWLIFALMLVYSTCLGQQKIQPKKTLTSILELDLKNVLSPSEMSFYNFLGFDESNFDEEKLFFEMQNVLRKQFVDDSDSSLVSLQLIIQANDVGFHEHSISSADKTQLWKKFDDPLSLLKPLESKEYVRSSVEILRFVTPSKTSRVSLSGTFVVINEANLVERVHIINRCFVFADNRWTEQPNDSKSKNVGKEDN